MSGFLRSWIGPRSAIWDIHSHAGSLLRPLFSVAAKDFYASSSCFTSGAQGWSSLGRLWVSSSSLLRFASRSSSTRSSLFLPTPGFVRSDSLLMSDSGFRGARVVIPWAFFFVFGVPTSDHGAGYTVRVSAFGDIPAALSDERFVLDVKAFRGLGVVIPWAIVRILVNTTCVELEYEEATVTYCVKWAVPQRDSLMEASQTSRTSKVIAMFLLHLGWSFLWRCRYPVSPSFPSLSVLCSLFHLTHCVWIDDSCDVRESEVMATDWDDSMRSVSKNEI